MTFFRQLKVRTILDDYTENHSGGFLLSLVGTLWAWKILLYLGEQLIFLKPQEIRLCLYVRIGSGLCARLQAPYLLSSMRQSSDFSVSLPR